MAASALPAMWSSAGTRPLSTSMAPPAAAADTAAMSYAHLTASAASRGVASAFAFTDALNDPLSRASSMGALHASSGGPAAGTSTHGGEWSPYEFNGGTALGLAGDDFAIIAADTRLSEGYSILSRDVSKAVSLTPRCAIATGGCYTDTATLHKLLQTRIAMYRNEHAADMTCTALAQMLAVTLYQRRMFPYYTFNIVAGLDADGRGAVFTYDAVGSYERTSYAAQGAGQKLIIPLFDELVGHKNRADARTPLTLDAAVALIKEGFTTAGERDIYTGDAVDIIIMTRDGGVRSERFELKKD